MKDELEKQRGKSNTLEDKVKKLEPLEDKVKKLETDLKEGAVASLQTSKWHSGGTKRPIQDMCFQGALWGDAKHESVL